MSEEEKYIKERYLTFIKNKGEYYDTFCGKYIFGEYIDCPMRLLARCAKENAYDIILKEFINLYGKSTLFNEVL